MRQFGNLTFHANQWTLKAEPHVIQVAKRLFSRASKSESGQITLKHSPAIARDLEWFLQRYPLAVDDPQRLAKFSQDYRDDIERRESIITGTIKPRKFKLAVSPREYQSTAAEVMLSQKSLLLGDEVGLGKTCTAICTIAQAETQPVCVVTLTHLPEQWRAEIVRFCPSMRVHIASKKTVYNVCNRHGQFPHVLIVPYSKLTGWKDLISDKCKTVIWDEAQELRRDESERWKAAAKIADAMEYRFGLTGTPVYNFGGEFFNVMRCISPDSLGTWEEFSREWCNGAGRHMKPRIQDPKAFGSYLREHHLMIRRTRNDVGRELPGLTKITHFVDPDSREFVKSDNRARELARLILQGSNKGDKFMAAGEFDALMRQTTGISKAVPVAAFVDMIIKSGEPVILYAWHRACFAGGTKVLMFDGSQKNIEDIVIGDRVMGPDSTPRTVKRLVAGMGEMFDVIPNRGQSFRCSHNHTLVFKNETKQIVKMTVSEYTNRSDRYKKSKVMFRADTITFPDGSEQAEPWLLGYWLGHGAQSLQDLRVSTNEIQVVAELARIAKKHGLKLNAWASKGESRRSTCQQIAFSCDLGKKNNSLLRMFKDLNLNKNRHIPQAYKTSPIECRLQLLAGLIDSNGYACKGNGKGTIQYTTITETLATDVAFVARSLGFAATIAKTHPKSGYGLARNPVFIVTISGDVQQIPARVEKRKGGVRAGQKNVLHVGFKVVPVGVEDYFGFELEEDPLFLLADFTVVHNCYDIYLSELAEHKPALYTGSESPAKKQSEIERFKSGETDLLIMSLRSGVGVDGLQKRCKTVVFGEFDWSPGVIEQDIGRVMRDGQTEPVIAYMIAVDAGADPYMLEVLGLKQDQVRGIRGESLMLEGKADATAVMRKLAERYLSKG